MRPDTGIECAKNVEHEKEGRKNSAAFNVLRSQQQHDMGAKVARGARQELHCLIF
jgi:hypothetical protein